MFLGSPQILQSVGTPHPVLRGSVQSCRNSDSYRFVALGLFGIRPLITPSIFVAAPAALPEVDQTVRGERHQELADLSLVFEQARGRILPGFVVFGTERDDPEVDDSGPNSRSGTVGR